LAELGRVILTDRRGVGLSDRVAPDDPSPLLAISLGAGLVWFGVLLMSVVYAVAIPRWVDPIYALDGATGNAAFNLIATGTVTHAAPKPPPGYRISPGALRRNVSRSDEDPSH
jgi:hypothetical protein